MSKEDDVNKLNDLVKQLQLQNKLLIDKNKNLTSIKDSESSSIQDSNSENNTSNTSSVQLFEDLELIDLAEDISDDEDTSWLGLSPSTAEQNAYAAAFPKDCDYLTQVLRSPNPYASIPTTPNTRSDVAKKAEFNTRFRRLRPPVSIEGNYKRNNTSTPLRSRSNTPYQYSPVVMAYRMSDDEGDDDGEVVVEQYTPTPGGDRVATRGYDVGEVDDCTDGGAGSTAAGDLDTTAGFETAAADICAEIDAEINARIDSAYEEDAEQEEEEEERYRQYQLQQRQQHREQVGEEEMYRRYQQQQRREEEEEQVNYHTPRQQKYRQQQQYQAEDQYYTPQQQYREKHYNDQQRYQDNNHQQQQYEDQQQYKDQQYDEREQEQYQDIDQYHTPQQQYKPQQQRYQKKQQQQYQQQQDQQQQDQQYQRSDATFTRSKPPRYGPTSTTTTTTAGTRTTTRTSVRGNGQRNGIATRGPMKATRAYGEVPRSGRVDPAPPPRQRYNGTKPESRIGGIRRPNPTTTITTTTDVEEKASTTRMPNTPQRMSRLGVRRPRDDVAAAGVKQQEQEAEEEEEGGVVETREAATEGGEDEESRQHTARMRRAVSPWQNRRRSSHDEIDVQQIADLQEESLRRACNPMKEITKSCSVNSLTTSEASESSGKVDSDGAYEDASTSLYLTPEDTTTSPASNHRARASMSSLSTSSPMLAPARKTSLAPQRKSASSGIRPPAGIRPPNRSRIQQPSRIAAYSVSSIPRTVSASRLPGPKRSSLPKLHKPASNEYLITEKWKEDCY